MQIQVLGSGCANCQRLYELTQKAAAEMKLKVKVEYISGNDGLKKMIGLGALGSPVLAVNNKIAMTGFTADIKIIKEKISQALK